MTDGGGPARGGAGSVVAARLVSPGRRRAWEDELVRFQIDELNSLYDGLASPPPSTARELSLARARARIAPILRAASWMPTAVARAVRATAEAGFDEPEDAFGAALLLAAPGIADRSRRDWLEPWLASIPSPVLALLGELGFAAGPGGAWLAARP